MLRRLLRAWEAVKRERGSWKERENWREMSSRVSSCVLSRSISFYISLLYSI